MVEHTWGLKPPITHYYITTSYAENVGEQAKYFAHIIFCAYNILRIEEHTSVTETTPTQQNTPRSLKPSPHNRVAE